MNEVRAIDCAKKLIARFGPLTPKRIHKTLFFGQIEMVVTEAEPMFVDPFEGWVDGPVVRDVWRTSLKPDSDAIWEPHSSCLGRVFERYKHLTDEELCELSHQHPLWLSSRQGLPPRARGNREIPASWFMGYYQKRAEAGHVEIINGQLVVWKANTSRFAFLHAQKQLSQLRAMGMLAQLQAMGVNTAAEFRVMEDLQCQR